MGHEIKVGTFILLSTALLVFIIMWLHKFDMTSYLHIVAQFNDVGTLSEGSSVLYRGVKAGTIYDITMSPDGEYVLVKMNITNKSVHLYKGSTASIIDKGFTGNKVLTIMPPDTLKGALRLKNGDIISGEPSFTLVEFQRLLSKMSRDGTLDSIISDSQQLLKTSKDLTQRLDKILVKSETFINEPNRKRVGTLLDNMTTLSVNLNSTSNNINKIINNQKFANDIKHTASSAKQAMSKLNEVVNKSDGLLTSTNNTIANLDNTVSNINNTTANVDKTLNDPNLHGSLKESIEKMSDILDSIKSITDDKEIQQNLKETLNQSKDGISSLNCFSKELSNTLSKRFLLPRMIIGKPGKNLERCTNLGNNKSINTSNNLNKNE